MNRFFLEILKMDTGNVSVLRIALRFEEQTGCWELGTMITPQNMYTPILLGVKAILKMPVCFYDVCRKSFHRRKNIRFPLADLNWANQQHCWPGVAWTSLDRSLFELYVWVGHVFLQLTRRRTICTPHYFNSVTVAGHWGTRPVDNITELV